MLVMNFDLQAAIIARKKEAAAEALQEAREEMSHVEQETNEKRQQAQQHDGEEVLKGEDVRKILISSCYMLNWLKIM